MLGLVAMEGADRRLCGSFAGCSRGYPRKEQFSPWRLNSRNLPISYTIQYPLTISNQFCLPPSFTRLIHEQIDLNSTICPAVSTSDDVQEFGHTLASPLVHGEEHQCHCPVTTRKTSSRNSIDIPGTNQADRLAS